MLNLKVCVNCPYTIINTLANQFKIQLTCLMARAGYKKNQLGVDLV